MRYRERKRGFFGLQRRRRLRPPCARGLGLSARVYYRLHVEAEKNDCRRCEFDEVAGYIMRGFGIFRMNIQQGKVS